MSARALAGLLLALVCVPRAGADAADRQIVFASNRASNLLRHQVYAVHLSGHARTVAGGLALERVWVTRDGENLFFANGATLESVELEGRRRRPLATMALPISDVRPSPDGRLAALVLADGTLWLADGTTGEKRKLADRARTPSWSPDGRFVAFSDAAKTVNVVAVDGGAPDPVGPGVRPDWSPDGRRLAFDLAGRVFVAAYPGGSPRALGPGSFHAWAPNAVQLAVVFGQKELRVVDLDGTRRHLTTIVGSIASGSLSYSPDGRRLAFLRYPPRRVRTAPQVYVVAAAGGAPRALTAQLPRASVSAPAWSGNVGLVYTALRYENDSELYAMAADGTAVAALTRTAASEIDPAWSPDRGTIAFTRLVTSESNKDVLLSMRSDGTGETVLSRPPPDFVDAGPAWSPDGKRVAFVRSGFGVEFGFALGSIFTIRSDGDDRRRLTSLEGAEAYPSWSPDGSTIAFTYYAEEGTIASPKVFVVGSDGSNPHALIGREQVGAPAYSPDGRRIAFVDTSGRSGALHVVDADGSHERRIVDSDVAFQPPSWSPDGRFLVYVRGDGDPQSYVLHRVGVDGTDDRALSSTPGYSVDPDWSR